MLKKIIILISVLILLIISASSQIISDNCYWYEYEFNMDNGNSFIYNNLIQIVIDEEKAILLDMPELHMMSDTLFISDNINTKHLCDYIKLPNPDNENEPLIKVDLNRDGKHEIVGQWNHVLTEKKHIVYYCEDTNEIIGVLSPDLLNTGCITGWKEI